MADLLLCALTLRINVHMIHTFVCTQRPDAWRGAAVLLVHTQNTNTIRTSANVP